MHSRFNIMYIYQDSNLLAFIVCLTGLNWFMYYWGKITCKDYGHRKAKFKSQNKYIFGMWIYRVCHMSLNDFQRLS